MGRGIMSFVAGLASGALKQYNYQTEQERLDAAEKRAAEEHTARMEERNTVIRKEREMAQASRPLDVIEGAPATPGGAPMTLPASMDERDIGTPGAGVAQAGVRLSDGQTFTDRAAGQAAAAASGTKDAIRDRQAATFRAQGNPLAAEQLETAGVQRKAAEMQITREQREWVKQDVDDKLKTITDGQSMSKVLSAVRGIPIEYVKSADGKTFNLVTVGADGTRSNLFQKPIEDTPESINRVIAKYSASMTLPLQVQTQQAFAAFDEQKRQHAAQEADAKEGRALQRQSNSISGASLGLQREEAVHRRANQDATLAIAQNADTRAAETHRYNTETLRSIPALERPIVQGMQDEVKNLQATINKMKGDDLKEWDPSKHKGQADLVKELDTARRTLTLKLQSITPAKKEATPRADNNPSAVVGSVAAKGLPPGVVPGGVDTTPYGGKAPPAAAAAAPATAVDPMRQQYAKESSDLNRGKREDFSPEVKAYIKRIKAEEQAQADAARAEEGRRAAAASRGLVAR